MALFIFGIDSSIRVAGHNYITQKTTICKVQKLKFMLDTI